MESPDTKRLAPRPRARISRLGWGLLIAQAILYVTISGTFHIARISLAFVLVEYVMHNPVKARLSKKPEDYPWLWTMWGGAKAIEENQETDRAT